METLHEEEATEPTAEASTSHRGFILGLLLFVALAVVSVGAGCVTPAAGLITGGILLAGWSWLFFGDVT